MTFEHTIGSHSDDRGGDSDRRCGCQDTHPQDSKIIPLYKHTGHTVRTSDWFCETCKTSIQPEDTRSIAPQDSDAEIDELLIDVAVRSANQYGGFEEWETPAEREEVIGKAKQALLALKARWEVESRDSEQNRMFAVMRNLGVKHDAKTIMMKRKEWERLTLQNQLPTKETK